MQLDVFRVDEDITERSCRLNPHVETTKLSDMSKRTVNQLLCIKIFQKWIVLIAILLVMRL